MKIVFLIMAGIFLWLSCSADNTAGTVSDTDTGKSAMVYNEDLTPAIGASVQFFGVNDTSRNPELETKTDSNGNYSFAGLDKGTYNVIAKKDSSIAFQDSVFISPASNTLNPDTLGKAGSITGFVRVQPNHDPRTVTVQVLGSDIYSSVDSSGRFILKPVAKGEYNLRVTTILPDYALTFTTIKTSGGRSDTLQDTITLTYTGIPVVTGLKVTYDTLNGVVHLSWNKTSYRAFQDFLIYRDDFDSINFKILPFSARLDTVFTDTIFKRQLDSGAFSFKDSNNYHLKYRVAIRSNVVAIGQTYKFVDVIAASPTKVRTFFSFRFLNTKTDSASINDTITIITNYTNISRKNLRLNWYVNNKDSLFKTVVDSSFSGCDTIKFTWNTTLKTKIYVSMTDTAQTTWWDSTSLTIVQDAPVIYAGKDTSFAINSKYTLAGFVTQLFGKIALYKWDFDGDGIYDDSSSASETTSHTYTHESVYKATFYVRDDDGNEAIATKTISVINNAPVITTIKHDTTIHIKDSIQLTGSAIDIDGTIKEYAWDLIGSGEYSYISSTIPNTSFRYNTAGIYNANFRVTDDDKKMNYHTVKITVLQDVPIPNAGNDTSVDKNAQIKLHGTAKDGFGYIKKMEWDIGITGSFIQTTTGDTTIIAPSTAPQSHLCIFKVTDDDDNIATDTLHINVVGYLTDIDGNVYRTVKIGNQEWMAANLRVTKYNDGTNIPQITEVEVWKYMKTPGYCWYRNDSAADNSTYGALYNWYAVNTEKLAPAGWHVPTDTDWSILALTIGGDVGAVGKLVNAGAVFVDTLTKATNETGFSAIKSGARGYDGFFTVGHGSASWWSANMNDELTAWCQGITFDGARARFERNNQYKQAGLAVRLVKD
jgi:uncharacterized protein (TIGR02145 family)